MYIICIIHLHFYNELYVDVTINITEECCRHGCIFA